MGNSLKNRRRIAQHAEPRGLYPECPWDRRVVRKEVLSGKMAPCFVGVESPNSELEECPICLLFYPGGLNRMTCCKQSMCTECYLQVKAPPPSTARSKCPFCKSDKFGAIYTGPLSLEQKQKIEVEQQKVLELQIKMQSEERKRDAERSQAEKKDMEIIRSSPDQEDSKKITKMPSSSSGFVGLPQHTSRSSISSVSSTGTPDVLDHHEMDTINHHALEAPIVGTDNLEYEPDVDLEQLMLEEVLRISLLEAKFGSLEPPSSQSQVQPQPSSTGTIDEKQWSLSRTLVTPRGMSSETQAIEEVDDEDDDEETRQAIALSLATPAPETS